ncbi:MAG: MGMT family protein [Candidatus Riflebacteria bacterium]|nr:MGMT family protein [Candidatus Riflebacteria bacterium]
MMHFTEQVLAIVRAIPAGNVATYGQIARLCGNPRGARQVSRILSSCSEKYDLPWHRVINSRGGISLGHTHGDLQRALLEAEGISFDRNGDVDLEKYQL